MKKLFVSALASVLCILGSASVSHADEIQLGEPQYGGSGCPQGSVSTVLNGSTLSVLFDQYMAEAGAATGRRLDRKSCNIRIPVHVPQGYSMSIFQVDYRGFASIPSGGRGTFTTEYFFAGARGPRQNMVMTGPRSQDLFKTDKLGVEALVWSRCGADVNLSANTALMAQSNARNEQAIMMIDSADVSASIVYHFQWKRCN